VSIPAAHSISSSRQITTQAYITTGYLHSLLYFSTSTAYTMFSLQVMAVAALLSTALAIPSSGGRPAVIYPKAADHRKDLCTPAGPGRCSVGAWFMPPMPGSTTEVTDLWIYDNNCKEVGTLPSASQRANKSFFSGLRDALLVMVLHGHADTSTLEFCYMGDCPQMNRDSQCKEYHSNLHDMAPFLACSVAFDCSAP